MKPEQDLALRQGGRILQLKQQLDKLCDQIRDRQLEREQQVQKICCQGNSYLKSIQTMREAEALLAQLRVFLTPEQGGPSSLPFEQAREMAAALCQKLQEEETAARQALEKSLQQAASSLLEGLELCREMGELSSLCKLAGDWKEKLARLAEGYPGAVRQGGGLDVGDPADQPVH